MQNVICNGFGRGAHDGHAHKSTLCYDRQKIGETPTCAKSCPTAPTGKRTRAAWQEIFFRTIP